MKLKIYHYFWITAIIILVIGLLDVNNPDAVTDINVHDTYFVIHQFHFAIILFVGYFLSGFGYWLVQKVLKKRLVKPLTIIHSVIMLGSFASYWIVMLYEMSTTQDAFPLFDENNIVNITLLISFLLITLVAKPVYFINLLIGIFRKSGGRPANTR